ncbi:4240_t:CDS:1, partial [Funneliformis geosporum]
ILTNGRFEQSKLDGELSKSDEYEKLVKDNSPDLVNSDGDKIDQTKIDGLKTAGGDAANAITTLGVGDLKDDTLKAKLGNKKLSDIPDSKNLESLLKTNEDLEKLLKGVGIDPTNFAETAKQIKK